MTPPLSRGSRIYYVTPWNGVESDVIAATHVFAGFIAYSTRNGYLLTKDQIFPTRKAAEIHLTQRMIKKFK